jgi:chromosomal replication initiation ATPase DnaA
MRLPRTYADSEFVELIRVMGKGVSKHGARKITDKIKEIDIEDNCKNYPEVRDFILDCVCSLMNVSKHEIIDKSKRGTVTIARKIAIIIIKNNFNISDEDVARFFNGRRRQVVYTIMKEFEKMDRNNKVDQRDFFSHYDIVSERTLEYIAKINK